MRQKLRSVLALSVLYGLLGVIAVCLVVIALSGSRDVESLKRVFPSDECRVSIRIEGVVEPPELVGKDSEDPAILNPDNLALALVVVKNECDELMYYRFSLDHGVVQPVGRIFHNPPDVWLG